MTGSPTPPEVEVPPVGIVCRACGVDRWEVLRTKKAAGCIRRWRKCLNCRGVSRTAERLEAGPHPDHDAR